MASSWTTAVLGAFNPVILWGAGAALLVGLFAGWSVRDWKADADALAAYEKAERNREKMQAKIDSSSQGYEDWRAEAEAGRIETRDTIREFYRNVEVPSDCDVPPAAASLLKERVANVNAATAGKSGGAVPKDTSASDAAD